MKRLTELLKSILIVLLLCSLILLAVASVPTDTLRESPWLSSLLQPVAPLLGLPQAELTYVAAAPIVQDAAQPVAISVRNSAGRSTAMWDFAELDARFDSLGSYLGQALDTAETFTKVSRLQLQSALCGTGVYFEYGVSLPAYLAASWLGANLEAAVPNTEACLLSVQNSAVQLYLIGETSYVAQTHLPADELSDLLETYRPDGSRLVCETDSPLWYLSILPGGVTAIPGGSVTNHISARLVEQLATDLGFNPYGEGRYTDSAGTLHFSEAGCSLEIEAGGRILLNASEDRFSANGPDLAALVETARHLTDLAIGGDAGAARLYLSGVHVDEDTTVCTFDYFYSGIPVISGSGSAASVTFRGTAVTQMTAQPLQFSPNEQTIYPLPAAQAAALLSEGDPLTLQYRLTADGTLDAGWKE